MLDMQSEQLDHWRKKLSSAELESALQFILELAPRPVVERAMKAREKFHSLDPALMRLALETARAREERRGSSTWSQQAYFLQSRIEQATRPEIATHHAQQFSSRHVLEVGCGIGFDTSALCLTARHVTAIDNDALCCAVTEHNLRLQGFTNLTLYHGSFEQFLEQHSLAEIDAIWADPGRRNENGERLYDPEKYRPPLSSVTDIAFPGLIGIKVSPALNINSLSDEWHHEFIGWEWSCPEQILWKDSRFCGSRATLADKDLSWHKTSDQHCAVKPELLTVDHLLIEPHPALVRTGDLEFFYAEHGLFQIDDQMALGVSSDKTAPSPWYREFRVIESFRYSLKALRDRLSALGWDSRTQIKKRGVQDDPDQVHRALKLPSPRSDSPWGFVILTKIENRPQAILAHRL